MVASGGHAERIIPLGGGVEAIAEEAIENCKLKTEKCKLTEKHRERQRTNHKQARAALPIFHFQLSIFSFPFSIASVFSPLTCYVSLHSSCS
jgi:hypothetical protein